MRLDQATERAPLFSRARAGFAAYYITKRHRIEHEQEKPAPEERWRPKVASLVAGAVQPVLQRLFPRDGK